MKDACKAAGAHYNPKGSTHGGAIGRHRHPGDLGNLMVDASGKATLDLLVPRFNLSDVIGRSIVIHASKDDLGHGIGAERAESLKTGNSGARIACAVLGLM